MNASEDLSCIMWSCLFVLAHTTCLVWQARVSVSHSHSRTQTDGVHMDIMLGKERAGVVVGGGVIQRLWNTSVWKSSITSIITPIHHGTLARTSLIMKTLEYMWMWVDILWTGKVSATCWNQTTKFWRTATLSYCLFPTQRLPHGRS